MKPYEPIELPRYELIDINLLLNELIDANRKISTYREKLKNTKVNPNNLIDFLMLKESLDSSKIEGTQATMDGVLENMATGSSSIDIQEVLNYRDAISHGVYRLNTLPISSRLFKELHKILLSNNVRGGTKAPGEFRSVQNFLGPDNDIKHATFIPPEPQLVNEYMSNLEKFINEDDDMNVLIKIAIIHSQFETIHPFLDGNGRIGRIIIPLYLYEKNYLDGAHLFISSSLEKDKYKYYRLLNATRINHNDDLSVNRKKYTEWIRFFLQSCINELDMLIEKINVIDSLFSETYAKAKTPALQKAVEKIFQYPIITSKQLREVMAPGTANRCLKTLCDMGILDSDDKKRNKTYYFYELINILR